MASAVAPRRQIQQSGFILRDDSPDFEIEILDDSPPRSRPAALPSTQRAGLLLAPGNSSEDPIDLDENSQENPIEINEDSSAEDPITL